MKKKQLLSAFALSTIALAQAGLVSADEVSPVDPSTPTTEVITPTTPTDSVETTTQPAQPAETSVVPTDPTTPSEQPSTPSDPTPQETPVEPTTPTEPVNPTTPTDPSDNPAGTTDPSDGNTTSPSIPAKPDPTPPQQTQSADQGNQQISPQEGTVSGSTGQTVQAVTPEASVQTNTGAEIASTKSGQLILSDGSTVAPETIGAKTNPDKTITVTKADGTKATLPHTGDEATNFLTVVGVALLGLVGFLFKKRVI